MDRTAKEAGLVTLVTSLLSIATPGCYMNPPIFYAKVAAPSLDKVAPQGVAPTRYHMLPTNREECHTFAATAADSMDPNGRRVRVCTDIDHSRPREHSHITTEVTHFSNALAAPAAPTPVAPTTPTAPRPVAEGPFFLGEAIELFKRQLPAGQRVMWYSGPEGERFVMRSFAVNTESRDKYLIVCEFARPYNSHPSTASGVCYVDNNLDGKVNRVYIGPMQTNPRAEPSWKKNMTCCMLDRSKRGYLPGCAPFKNVSRRNQNMVNLGYRNLTKRIQALRNR